MTPTAWVTDAASLLSTQTASALNIRLRDYERRTGHQVLVYIASTTGGIPIEDWAVRAFERWKVGRSGLDDGLVLFIFTQDRTLRIEVGYGLESTIPDALASRIIRETITPALRAGQPDRGVTEGVDRLLARIGDSRAQPGATSGDGIDEKALSPLEIIFAGIFLLVLITVAIRSPWFVVYLLVNIFGGRGGGFSGGGGGFSGGGGGFSGGGGRSGGGGASGRW